MGSSGRVPGRATKNERFEMQKDLHRATDAVRSVHRPDHAAEEATTPTSPPTTASATRSVSRPHKTRFPRQVPSREGEQPNGMMWIGPAGTVTSLHHDLTNNLIAQIVGRKRLQMVPAADVGKLYNHKHVFSEGPDLEDPALDLGSVPAAGRSASTT